MFKLDFYSNWADTCLHTLETEIVKKLIIALYVDYGLISTNDKPECLIFFAKLKDRFKIITGDGMIWV